MKKILSLLAFFFAAMNVFSQDLNVEIRPMYTYPIKQESLRNPERMSDLIAAFPFNWIDTYTSSRIRTSHNGKTQEAVSTNDTLSTEQKELLKAVGLAAKIEILIEYSHRVSVTHVIEHNTIRLAMTVVPETEAVYPDGAKQLIRYVKENSLGKIPATTENGLQQTLIRFTIDEQGKATDAKLIRSFGDPETDCFFMELIQSMPAWKPAENPKGVRVKQEFEFIAGRGGGC